MKQNLVEAFVTYAEGMKAKHLANVSVYFNNPAGIGEHPDIMESIEQELSKAAEYQDMIEMVKENFK